MHKNTRLFFLFVDDVNWFFSPSATQSLTDHKKPSNKDLSMCFFLSILSQPTWNDFIVVSIEKRIHRKEFSLLHYKKESVVRNHVKLRGFSKDTLLFGGYWLWAWRISWNCRPALPKGRKYQMVKTQTESHDRRPIV